MHTQMLSFEDSTIRDAVFPARSEEETESMSNQEKVAWIGIDWADEGSYCRTGGLSSEERGAASCSALAGSTKPAPN